MERKKELRKQIALRKASYGAMMPQLSAAVLAALEAHPVFGAANTVLLYYSLADEVDTHAFIRKWSDKKRILLPAVVGNDLELRIYTCPEDLQPGAYGIEEPIGTPFANYAAIDFAVIPGIAFDRQGNRLGRGKGYYDRLLPQLPSTYKAGICFPFQLVKEIPTDPHDVRMDGVITTTER